MWEENKRKEPLGKCFSCGLEIIVHDFAPDEDPWYLHQDRAPECHYIALGKKKFPQDYKFQEIYSIVVKKHHLLTVRLYFFVFIL